MITSNEKEQFTESIRDFVEVQTGICRQLATLSSQLEEQDKQLAAATMKTQEHYIMLETLKTDLSTFPDRVQITDFTKELQTVSTDLRVAGKKVSMAAKHIPVQVQTQVTHRFEGRLKWMVITIICSVLITSLSLSLWIGSLRANSRLRQQDIKYRYLKKVAPIFTLHSDTLFLNDPKGFTNSVQKWELQQAQQQKAWQEYQQKQQEAEEAKKKLTR